VPHPSSHNEQQLLQEWHQAINELRPLIDGDPDGNQTGANYGNAFRETDYAAIPRRDLPFGVPDFLGDDRAGRAHQHPSSVSRPVPDDLHTLIWKATPS